MIREFSVRPMPKNKNARTLFFILLAAAVATVAVSYFLTLYKGIVQLVALILLVFAVMVYTRYLGAVYSYEVTHDSDTTPIFVVCRFSGKRCTTLCRVDLADIADIEVLTAAAYRAYKPNEKTLRYKYTPTLFPEEVHLMKVRSFHERADIFLELSAECRDTLLSFAADARAQRCANEEV